MLRPFFHYGEDEAHSGHNMISNTLKKKVTRIVEDYKEKHPKEYKQFVKQTKLIRENSIPVKDTETCIQQRLFDTPETLYFMFRTNLTDLQYRKYQNPTDGGALWFWETFKEFRIAKKI